MKHSTTSPYKMKDSILNYDTSQYQELMKNFENLIKVTQEKLHCNQKQLEETCQCSDEDQYLALQQENYNLKQMIEELRQYQEAQQINLKEQFQNVVDDYASKSIQQNRLIEELQIQLYEAQQNLIQEKNRHNSTVQKFQEVQEEYILFRSEKKKQQFYEFEVTEKITQGYSDLAQENQKLRLNEKLNFQEIDRLRLALNQAYLSLSKHEFRMKQRNFSDSSFSSCETQTDAIIYDQKEILKERINNSLSVLEKNLLSYLEKKKMRNKSANETKFYSDFQEWIQMTKNELVQLRNQVNISQREDFELKENNQLIMKEHQQFIKDYEEKKTIIQLQAENYEEQAKVSEKNIKDLKQQFEKEKKTLSDEIRIKTSLSQQLENQLKSNQQTLKQSELEKNSLRNEIQQLSEVLQQQKQEINDYIEQLQFEKVQSSQAKPSILENSYMTNKIEDLESILREKDQKMEEFEKLYHLTSYELRTLQDYQQSLENECQILKQELKRLQLINSQQQQMLENYEEQVQQKNNKINQSTETIILQKDVLSQNGQIIDNQQTQNKIQVKILSGEIQRLNSTILVSQRKIQDLEYILEKFVNSNKENKQLAKQIYLQATQTGRVNVSNVQEVIQYNEVENLQPQDSFEIMVYNLKNQPDTN